MTLWVFEATPDDEFYDLELEWNGIRVRPYEKKI